MKIVNPSVETIFFPANPLSIIETSGRVCYQSEAKGNPEDFVRMILKRGHESVIEHVSATFRIVCDRGVTHEIVRHRIASYSQESTRYCNYAQEKFGTQIKFIQPPGLNKQQLEIFNGVCSNIETAYMTLIELGVSPQIARGILPNCLKTEIIMTANFREWRHFLRLRTGKAAHPQMREISYMIYGIFKEKCPVIVEDVSTGELYNG